MVDGIQSVSNPNVQSMTDMREQMFTRLDTDGDGQIDLAEITATAQETGESDGHFTRMLEGLTAADTDGDGMVSREEFEQIPAPPPPPSFSGKSEQGLFDLLDSDGDGQIDLTEIQAHVEKTEESESGLVELLEKLTEADTDGDGIVTREEFNQLELAQKTYPELGDMSGQLYTKDISAIDSGDLTGRLFNQLG